MDVFGRSKMVRFQSRWITKSYKGKDHLYRICSVNFPVKLHDKVGAKTKKDFEVEWSEQETDEEEIVNVTFRRNRTQGLPTK